MCKILIINNDINTPLYIHGNTISEFLQNNLPSLLNTIVDIIHYTGKNINWDSINSNEYDLYLIEYYINGITGQDIVSKIRQNDVNVPIIIYSEELNLEDSLKLIQSGGSDYLNKKDIELLPYIIQRQLIIYKRTTQQIQQYQQMNDLLVNFANIMEWIVTHSYSEISFYKVLKNFGKILNVSRVYLYERTNDSDTLKYVLSHQWYYINVCEQCQYETFTMDNAPTILNTIENKEIISSSLNDFTNYKEYDMLVELDIQSFAIVPVIGLNNCIIGFVGFDDSKIQRNWTNMELNILSTIASILGTIYNKKQQQDKEYKLFQKGVNELRNHQLQLNNTLKTFKNNRLNRNVVTRF